MSLDALSELLSPNLAPALTPSLSQEIRQSIAGLLEGAPSASPTARNTKKTPDPASDFSPAPATRLSAWLPYIAALKSLILQDLESNLNRLLTLNSTRREAVAGYLDRLAGQAPSPTALGNNLDPAGGLRRWIEGPRNSAQDTALQCYFEEIALLVLGQAVLLKSWSDRGLRAWTPADLNNLNWALNSAIKPHVPLDRESWQVASQNIYTWYKPSPTIQREIWITLDSWQIPTENPTFLAALISSARKALPESPEPQGYDSRFYQSLWENMPHFGFDPENSCPAYRRSWSAFSPTLRDGSLMRTGPSSVQWVGLDSSPFLLMMAELLQLWWGFSTPPLWAIGNGLEVPTRDQLMLNLSVSRASPKPSLFSRIAEWEACDVSFVFEERCVRGQGRGAEAQSFREQCDSSPYFRRLRATGTSLGELQACVALGKLRPGGLLWWTREEALDGRAGSEVLNFLLERAKLICEWSLAEVEHGLPTSKAPFPRHIYVFQREPRIEERLAHRPLHICLRGQLRSHVEIPNLLDDALQTARGSVSPRGSWLITTQQSPTPQKEWADRWPEPATQSTLMRLDALREVSLPLASATTIRPTPDTVPSRQNTWSVDPAMKGFWIHAEAATKDSTEGRKLFARPLPKPGSPTGAEAAGSGFLILVADESCVAPLRRYLESDIVSQWLEHQCERKNDRWVLNEQIVRCLPVPRHLLRSLGLAGASAGENGQLPAPLAPQWERVAANLATEPRQARQALSQLRDPREHLPTITEIFVRAARTLERMQSAPSAVFTLVDTDGRIRWGSLLSILPRTETVSIPLCTRLTIQGHLPPNIPISHIAAVKMPSAGFILTTEAGLSLKILSDSARIRDMLWDQIQGLTCPTWSELLHFVKLPRRLEVAEETANEVLRAHGEQTARMTELSQLLSECPLF